jgi:RimJ/RimL family protein N-acetyltransferase
VISLRNVELTDADWIFDACQDPTIQRWTRVPRPYLRSHADEFVRGGTPEVHKWVICAGDDAIGLIGVHSITEGVAEIGYWVAPWGRGQRAVTQAIGLVVDELKSASGASSLTAVIAEGNVASRKSAERAGLTEYELRADGCPDGDELTNAVVYRLDFSHPSS